MRNFDTDDQSTRHPRAGSLKRWHCILLATGGFAFTVIVVIWIQHALVATPSHALPDLEDVVSIRAQYSYDPTERNWVEFEVPKEFWTKIFSCLAPSENDSSPAKWQNVGRLITQTKSGQQVRIWLYHTNSGPGAFSVGPDTTQRTYYRGGDSVQLEKSLLRAYALAKERAQNGSKAEPD